MGLWYSGVTNGVGGRKTRKNLAQKRLRNRNDQVNGHRCEQLLRKHDASAVAAANAELEAVTAAERLRAHELEMRGSRAPKHCTDSSPESPGSSVRKGAAPLTRRRRLSDSTWDASELSLVEPSTASNPKDSTEKSEYD